jgi:putative endonuclease
MLTDWNKKVLYTGFTNNLPSRLIEHWIGKSGSFTKDYNAYYLVWCESTKYVLNAIGREKEIKDWTRIKKEELIEDQNPEWRFMNEDVLGNWPPSQDQIEEVKESRGHNKTEE